MKKKNGFTLVELLAVIVVLAVVILIASSGIGSALQKARKSALAIEGNELVNAAKNAYQLDMLDGKVKRGNACYSLEYLNQEGVYSKGAKEGYTGSVLVTNNGNQVTYKFWIGNGSFNFANEDVGATGTAAVPATDEAPTASENCGNVTGATMFQKKSS